MVLLPKIARDDYMKYSESHFLFLVRRIVLSLASSWIRETRDLRSGQSFCLTRKQPRLPSILLIKDHASVPGFHLPATPIMTQSKLTTVAGEIQFKKSSFDSASPESLHLRQCTQVRSMELGTATYAREGFFQDGSSVFLNRHPRQESGSCNFPLLLFCLYFKKRFGLN